MCMCSGVGKLFLTNLISLDFRRAEEDTGLMIACLDATMRGERGRPSLAALPSG
jgi:hypothetical protein